jgi:hypothetical protein
MNIVNETMRHTAIKFILEEIQNEISFDKILEIWKDNEVLLDDCTYVFSNDCDFGLKYPENSWNKTFSKGFIRPAFAFNNLFYVDNRVIKDSNNGKPSFILADATSILDSNTVGAIERFVNKKSDSNIDEIVDFIIKEKINFNYGFYAIENQRFYEERINVPSIWEKIRCVLHLDWIDLDIYKKSKEIVLTIDKTELNILTDEKIDDLFKKCHPAYDYFQELQITLHAIILKILQIQFTSPKKKVEFKMQQLIEFMHSELKTIYMRELIIGLMFFHNPNLLFFKSAKTLKSLPTIRKNKREEKRIKFNGMAWDLTLLRFLERASTNQKIGDFLIPHLISFDLDMIEIFDKVQLKGFFAYDNQTRLIPIFKKRPLKIMESMLDIESINDYFLMEKSVARTIWQSENIFPTNRELRDKLENEVLNLLIT